MERIIEEDYNLNISRYISTSASEEEVDLAVTYEELISAEEQIVEATIKHNEFLSDLGLSPLPTN